MSPKRIHPYLAWTAAILLLSVAMVSLISSGSDAEEAPTRALPSRVNLSRQVPYHMRAGEELTGEASLSMLFDYHGPYIMQQDIRNVTKGLTGSGVASADELIRASHYSKLLPQTPRGYEERTLGYGAFKYDWRDEDDRSDMRFADLYSALADGHPVLCYMYLSIPPELNPDPQPPDPNNPQPPDPKVTPEDLAALEKVWRLVVGYDSNQGSGVLIVHDPIPSGTGFLGGKSRTVSRENFEKLWNIHQLKDQRISTNRIGMTAAPWKLVDLDHPDSVNAGRDFEISVNVTYEAPPVMIGASASSSMVSLDLPEEYQLADGSEEISLDIEDPGTFHEVSWTVTAPERGYPGQDWRFYLNATGNVTVGNPEPHFDRIGARTTFEVETEGYLNHPPIIEGAMIDPELVPDDGSMQPLISARVQDEDGNIQSVQVDLSPINGNAYQRLYDDGSASSGDEVSGDGIYSFKIKKMMDQGEYVFKITVKDTLGGRAYENVSLTVEDAAVFTNAPVIEDKGVHPMKIPNDGVTKSLVWAIVEDEENDIDTVSVDLSNVGGEDDVRMYDDGTSGDVFSADGNYSVEFTVSPLVEISIYQVEITATDRAGHETSAKAWVDVVLPAVAPVITEVSTLPEEVPNDGETPVVLSAMVEDDNEDVENVWVDLTPLGGPNKYDLRDDGVSPDTTANDGTWTVEFTVGRSVSEGLKGRIDIFAEDSAGLRGSTFFSLTVERANTPPMIPKTNVSNADGDPVRQFSEGEKVFIEVVALDDDPNDILTVTLDLSELGLDEITLKDDDEDDRYSGDFVVPANTSGKRNITAKVTDSKGATDTVRIGLTIEAPQDEEAGPIDTQYVLIGAGISFVLLLILAVAAIVKSSGKTSRRPPMPAQRPMVQGRPPMGPPSRATR